MSMLDECRTLTNDELSRGLKFLAAHEKHNTARLIAHLAEYDRRNLSVERGGRSLFEHCVKVLGFDDGDAFRRVKAARFVRRHPAALAQFADGEVSLSVLALLGTLPKEADAANWLKLTAGLSRRDAETLIAAKFPQCARADILRRMPSPFQWAQIGPAQIETTLVKPPQHELSPASSVDSVQPTTTEGVRLAWTAIPAPAAPLGRLWQDVSPVSAERIRIGFDAAASVMQLIERARQVLRHKYPEGRLEDVVRESLEALLDYKDPQRKLLLKSPSPDKPDSLQDAGRLPMESARAYVASRYITAKVKTAVWERDEGRCAWRYEDGILCGSQDSVEYDHVIPFAKGGRSHMRNLRLLCRAHNRLAAEREFPRPDGPPGAEA